MYYYIGIHMVYLLCIFYNLYDDILNEASLQLLLITRLEKATVSTAVISIMASRVVLMSRSKHQYDLTYS